MSTESLEALAEATPTNRRARRMQRSTLRWAATTTCNV